MTVTQSAPQGSHFDVVIIGASPAGLSLSQVLKQAGVRHVVLEKHRIGRAGRNGCRGSSPPATRNGHPQPPGHTYAGEDPDGFMLEHEIVEHLGQYVKSIAPPVLEGVGVERVRQTRRPPGQTRRFVVETTMGTLTADHVVAAAGGDHDSAERLGGVGRDADHLGRQIMASISERLETTAHAFAQVL